MKVYLAPRVVKQLEKLPNLTKKLVIKKIKVVGKTPLSRASKKLSHRQGWRIRVGDYRILYTIDKKKREVTILSVAHRREIYK